MIENLFLQAYDHHWPYHPCDFSVVLVRLMEFCFRIKRMMILAYSYYY